MTLFHNALRYYTDEQWKPPEPDWLCSWGHRASHMSIEELCTLERYLYHTLEFGDDVPFDWPPHLDPDRIQRIPILPD